MRIISTKRFDKQAPGWDKDPGKIKLAGAVARELAALPLARDMTALDFGCGTGLVSFFLRKRLGKILAADSSPGMMRVLKAKVAAAPAGKGSAAIIPYRIRKGCDPFGSRRYDLIFSSMVFHHIKDTVGTLRKFYRGLKPGGWAAVADLVKEDGSFHPDPQGIEHFGFEPRQIRKLFDRAGFCGMRISRPWVIKKNNPGTRRTGRYPVFLITARRPL